MVLFYSTLHNIILWQEYTELYMTVFYSTAFYSILCDRLYSILYDNTLILSIWRFFTPLYITTIFMNILFLYIWLNSTPQHSIPLYVTVLYSTLHDNHLWQYYILLYMTIFYSTAFYSIVYGPIVFRCKDNGILFHFIRRHSIPLYMALFCSAWCTLAF